MLALVRVPTKIGKAGTAARDLIESFILDQDM